LEIANSLLFGAYRKVSKGSRMVTSPMTSRDCDIIVMTSQRQNALASTILVRIWSRRHDVSDDVI